MHDKFKKRFRAKTAGERVRGQIAREAARRMLPVLAPAEGTLALRDVGESEYYAAKRRAAAVLGHTVRPGDLPTDSEVREAALELLGDRETEADLPEPDESGPARMADHIDRFEIYRMRLLPLASVKQNPKWHPEGDALYHSLQVFERARQVRPYDEEFLLAALLHDVGKGIDPHDHVGTALLSLDGAITPRTFWLIEHHMDLLARPDRPISPKLRALVESSEFYDDLVLLRDCDDAGREQGAVVPSIDEALDYLRGLEAEDYLAT